MDIPLHVTLRRKFRSFLYKIMSLFIKNNTTNTTLNPDEIQSILIVRPNYRIGNLLFLTPLLEQLQTNMPHTKVDIIVGMKLAGDILQEIPNVKNVFSLPRDILYKPHKFLEILLKVRKTRYDLVLNISAGSLSSELVTLLTKATYKASFESNKTLIPLTHKIKREHLFEHAGSKPLELLKIFPFKLPTKEQELQIFLTQEEKKKAKDDFEKLLQNNPKQKVISIFRNARFDKKIEDSWWLEWFEALKKIDKDIVVVDVLSPDVPTKLHHDMLEYQNKNLRILGAFFQQTSLYISADTGPLHLALASKAKTLALFNKTSKERYGTLGEENLTLDINNLTPQEVAQESYNLLVK